MSSIETDGKGTIMRSLLFLILSLVSFSSHAFDNTTQRINGVAEFLIERANDNYLYIFQRKVENNSELKCYFPTTYENLSIGGSTGLKRLLTSRELWKDSIRKDLEFLTLQSLAREIETTIHVSEAAAKIASKTIDIIQLFKLDINGTQYALNVVPIGASADVKNKVNGFTLGIGNVVNALNRFRKYKNLCLSPDVSLAKFKSDFEALKKINDDLNSWIKHLEKNAGNLVLANTTWANICQRLDLAGGSCTDAKSTIDAFKQQKLSQIIDPKLTSQLSVIKDTIETIRDNKEEVVNQAIRDAVCKKLSIVEQDCTDKQAVVAAVKEIVNARVDQATGSSTLLDAELLDKIKAISEIAAAIPVTEEDITTKVFSALKKIKAEAEAELKRIQDEIDRGIDDVDLLLKAQLEEKLKRFDKLSKHILFFSSIADASTADEVKTILKNYTLPSVSFFEKREEGNHFMVTSYLGLSYNLDEESAAEKSNNGIFAPVGLEYSRGVDWFNGYVRSASVMVSPFDFGHPINLKLNDIEEDIDYDEIVAPSVTFAMGFKDYPLTLGLGYQKGRQLELTGESEDRVILFFAFDMPLLNLHGD